uniref:Proteasome subunit beta n=1 Tax=Aplanochytrium stocchinoi TaxID=215587 RepID=A0A7S3PSL6_9STRA|mmetsp:Transcript_2171/g.2789  ORF Transcript_2171/g.2789 Transcript_2171/m.2789 type:complete len:293 (+) Transcript_2171:154-1032(+)|eukprot:CAMPEP_0204829972 /NCGR_PEP_ID=MMETSP1346-20131115/8252_1 /ASSEMBLY_ACC=CAM_ASM_000771 /TAXON_ID=215587 /ORGANISM="Aplanochytrium stocchinoi, Strain GSBS06" /LENGTH=292 /DNA_ID=CAMNT_0051960071 /DNA_START=125 /DNA_END=1003 /DNA_ORIENTATION=+
MDFLKAPPRGLLRQRGMTSFGSGATCTDALGNPVAANLGTEKFELPSFANPAEFVNSHFSPGTYEDNGQRLKFDKGTTTIAFKYRDGIIVAVDSRASQGPYVGSQTVEKVIPINDRLLGTMAGGAADCLFWQRNLGMQCRIYELKNKEPISVAAASKLLANNMAYYKGMGLSMGTMVTGWDKSKGFELYYVDNDATRLRATRKHPFFAVGSGGTYAYGILDSEYEWDMDTEKAIDLGRKAIYHATYRDAYSGGMNNVYVVTQDGWEKLKPIDVYELHERYGPASRDNAMDIN